MRHAFLFGCAVVLLFGLTSTEFAQTGGGSNACGPLPPGPTASIFTDKGGAALRIDC